LENNSYRIWGGDKLTARYSLKPPNLNAGYAIKEISDNPAFRKKFFCLKKKGGPSRIISSLQARKLDKGPGIV